MARTLVTLALFLALAAPAQAAGTLTGAGSKPAAAGPVWAGERVVWVTVEPPGVLVHVADPSGANHSVASFSTPYADDGLGAILLSASTERWAFSTFMAECGGKYMSCNYFAGTFTAPLGGLQETIVRRCATPQFGNAGVSITEGALAYTCGDTVRVRDLRDGGESDEFPGRLFRLAGPFLASSGSEPGTVVRDWRTGAERLRVPDTYGGFLQADGKLVFVRGREGNRQIAWASPESPEPRVVAEGDVAVFGFAGDRVALRNGTGFEIRALDGSVVKSSPSVPPVTSEFDGRRLVWAERRCVLLALVSWDLDGEPPRLPSGKCPHAGNRSKLLRVKPAEGGHFGYGTVRTTLACPPEPALGCGGKLELRLGPHQLDIARGDYELLPGETRTVRFGLLKRRICKAGRRILGPVLLTIDDVKRRWVRISGARRALAECEGRT